LAGTVEATTNVVTGEESTILPAVAVPDEVAMKFWSDSTTTALCVMEAVSS
jgi:hypothetical protein